MSILTERYDMNIKKSGTTNREIENQPLNRIADAIEEILRLVKLDQERSKKYMEERKDD